MTGDEIRELLERFHVNQTDMAHFLGVTPRSMRYWIRDGIDRRQGSAAAVAHTCFLLLRQMEPAKVRRLIQQTGRPPA